MEDSYLKLLRTRKTCLFLDTHFQELPRGGRKKNKEKSSELLNECKEAAANARVITAPETDPAAAAKRSRLDEEENREEERWSETDKKNTTKHTKKHNKVR